MTLKSGSLKVVPFDRLFMVSSYYPTVTLSVRRTVFIIDIRLPKCRDLENRVQGSVKVIENVTIR